MNGSNVSSAVSNRIATYTPSVTTLRISVGTKNPCKIQAVRQAFEKILEGHSPGKEVELQISGYKVPSGVTDQPMGDEETCLGARNRARACYSMYVEEHRLAPHFCIGLEGGLEYQAILGASAKTTLLLCMAWMAIYGKQDATTVSALASSSVKSYHGDRKLVFGVAKTASFVLPPDLQRLIEKEGLELGDADDRLFGRINGKHGSGTVGILTDNVIDRAEYYGHALILALTPWIRPDVYGHGNISDY